MEKKCKYCNEEFRDVSGRWFSNHVRWCNKNPSRNDIQNIIVANKKSFDDRFGSVKEFEVYCIKCNKPVIVKEREKLHPKKNYYFCSVSCKNSHLVSDETREKISETLSLPKQTRKCLECNQEFEVRITSKKKFCSIRCGSISRKSSNEYLRYRHACSFSFNVWDYPSEFDLGLIYKHGWYKAKNRGDNLNGISRDHRISVKFGWENGIDSKIISHPANCQLMQHNDNISKHKKCSVLLEQLKRNIDNWNVKYGSEV